MLRPIVLREGARVGLVRLLFSFNGRIGRAQYWLGSIGVYVAGWALTCMLTFSTTTSFKDGGKDPLAMLHALASFGLVISLVMMFQSWCAFALQVKRFHDRGQSGWWSLLPAAPMLFVIINVFSAVTENWPAERLFAAMGLPLLAYLLIGFGLFINLGCLPGVSGPNKYGDPSGSDGSAPAPGAPAPLPGNSAAPAANSLFGAQTAIERAIAEKSRAMPTHAQTQARTHTRPATPLSLAPAAGSAPAFGKRTR